jgi:putative ABC transport system permease protein
MSTRDLLRLAWHALWFHRQRSALTMLGILIGIASVILLTSIGEGTRTYVLSQFTQFGTTLASVSPGKISTSGLPGALGSTVYPLTFDDAEALERVPGLSRVVPVVMGAAPVEFEGRTRNSFVYGVTADAPEVWRMGVRAGRFLPRLDLRQGAPVAVLGPKLKREIFGDQNSLGRHVRISGQRYLVIGLMEPKGQFLGFDIDDSAYIPVAEGRRLFNRDALHEIDLLIANASLIEVVTGRVRDLLKQRHKGTEDFTITTQTGMLETLDRIIRIVSLAVGGIGGISLLVGSIGILTMMWISVNERTSEIGLARAIGATPQQILLLFLSEATLLSMVGGVLGLVAGMGLAQLLHHYVPALPVRTPPEFVLLALAVSCLVGLLSGLLPARRASRLNPVAALTAE